MAIEMIIQADFAFLTKIFFVSDLLEHVSSGQWIQSPLTEYLVQGSHVSSAYLFFCFVLTCHRWEQNTTFLSVCVCVGLNDLWAPVPDTETQFCLTFFFLDTIKTERNNGREEITYN